MSKFLTIHSKKLFTNIKKNKVFSLNIETSQNKIKKAKRTQLFKKKKQYIKELGRWKARHNRIKREELNKKIKKINLAISKLDNNEETNILRFIEMIEYKIKTCNISNECTICIIGSASGALVAHIASPLVGGAVGIFILASVGRIVEESIIGAHHKYTDNKSEEIIRLSVDDLKQLKKLFKNMRTSKTILPLD